MNNPKDMEILEKLTDILDTLKIPYAISGSMASSAYGAVRFTQDADIAVAPFDAIAEKFFESIKSEFYISKEAMRQALRKESSFNVIHFATAFKIDIFVLVEDEFWSRIIPRKCNLRLTNRNKEMSFVSPKDMVLIKLDWYRHTECSSDRQWSDVIAVLSAQSQSLDYKYMQTSAEKLGIGELLQKALAESEK